MTHAGDFSSSFVYFAQLTRLHIVDKPAHRDMLGNPRVQFHAPYLLAHIGFKVVESMEVSRLTGDHAHLLGQPASEFVFPYLQQAAIRVVDDDELLRVEQVMRDDQGTQGVVGGNAARVADHVGIAGTQAEAMLKQDARVHAGQNGHMALGAHRKLTQLEIAGEIFVGF